MERPKTRMRSSRCRDHIVTVPVWRECGACGKSCRRMLPLSPSRIHLTGFASMPDRLVVWLRAVAMPGVWPGLCIIGIVVATLLASWLSGQVWVAAVVGVAGMVLTARY